MAAIWGDLLKGWRPCAKNHVLSVWHRSTAWRHGLGQHRVEPPGKCLGAVSHPRVSTVELQIVQFIEQHWADPDRHMAGARFSPPVHLRQVLVLDSDACVDYSVPAPLNLSPLKSSTQLQCPHLLNQSVNTHAVRVERGLPTACQSHGDVALIDSARAFTLGCALRFWRQVVDHETAHLLNTPLNDMLRIRPHISIA